MKGIYFSVVYFLLASCMHGPNNSDASNGVSQFVLNDGISIESLGGRWVASCVVSGEYENSYEQRFIDNTLNDGNVTFGKYLYVDSDCTQSLSEKRNDSGELMMLPSMIGIEVTYSVLGTYTTMEGIQAKVIEVAGMIEGSSRVAFIRDADNIFVAYSNGSSFNFNYSDPYALQ